MTLLGHLALWLALLLALWGAAADTLGARHGRDDLTRSAGRAARATAVVLTVAVAVLAAALVRHDFSLAYVAANTSRTVPAPYRWAAVYAGPEGALLCIGAVVAGLAAFTRDSASGPRAVLAALVAVSGASVLLAFDPFARVAVAPLDGRGLDPGLQHPAGMLSAGLLYLGWALLAHPAAHAAAGLAERAPGRYRTGGARCCLTAAWALLSAGLLLAVRAADVAPAPAGEIAGTIRLAAATTAWVVVTMLVYVAARGTVASRVRRAGAIVAHAGAVVAAVGLVGRAFAVGTSVTLRPAESASLARAPAGRYTLTYLGASHYERRNQLVAATTVEVARGGRRVAVLRAERVRYADILWRPVSEPVSRVAALAGVWADVHAELAGAVGEGEAAPFRFTVRPFGGWLWLGGWVVILGGVAAQGGFTQPSRRPA